MRIFRHAQKSPALQRTVELGKCFRGGRGVDKDMKEALRLFRRAAESGSMDAHVELGEGLSAGITFVEKNKSEAVRLFRIAADSGNQRRSGAG